MLTNAQLVKIYGASPESAKGRDSPAECTGARKERIEGNPNIVICGTARSYHENEHPQVHAADERHLEKDRKARSLCRLALYALQFRAHSHKLWPAAAIVAMIDEGEKSN